MYNEDYADVMAVGSIIHYELYIIHYLISPCYLSPSHC